LSSLHQSVSHAVSQLLVMVAFIRILFTTGDFAVDCETALQ